MFLLIHVFSRSSPVHLKERRYLTSGVKFVLVTTMGVDGARWLSLYCLYGLCLVVYRSAPCYSVRLVKYATVNFPFACYMLHWKASGAQLTQGHALIPSPGFQPSVAQPINMLQIRLDRVVESSYFFSSD